MPVESIMGVAFIFVASCSFIFFVLLCWLIIALIGFLGRH